MPGGALRALGLVRAVAQRAQLPGAFHSRVLRLPHARVQDLTCLFIPSSPRLCAAGEYPDPGRVEELLRENRTKCAPLEVGASEVSWFAFPPWVEARLGAMWSCGGGAPMDAWTVPHPRLA